MTPLNKRILQFSTADHWWAFVHEEETCWQTRVVGFALIEEWDSKRPTLRDSYVAPMITVDNGTVEEVDPSECLGVFHDNEMPTQDEMNEMFEARKAARREVEERFEKRKADAGSPTL